MYFNFRNKIRKIFERKAIVLMYHRIADIEIDPWQLAVSPQNFEEHLQVLSTNFNVIPVDHLINNVASKSISPNSVSITFDDGYNDNYYKAKPLLEKYSMPATFFIASHFVNSSMPYWWDDLETIILHVPKLPQTLQIAINNNKFFFRFKNSEILTLDEWHKQSSWVWPDTPPTERCELYLQIWEQLKPLPYPQIESVINELREWAKSEGTNRENLPMTNEQLVRMSSHPLFNIGIHSATHPALSFHDKNNQGLEVEENRMFLKSRCKRVSNTMAYPYGNYNDDTLKVVEEKGLDAAFTTEEQLITSNSSRYRLGRFQVNNWSGEKFEKQVYKWLKSY